MTTVSALPTDLAARQLSLPGDAPVEFGVGAVDRLPAVLASLGLRRLLVVTDPGIRVAGVLDQVLAPLAAAGLDPGIDTVVFDEVHPNPSTSDVRAGVEVAAPLLDEGTDGLGILAVGGGSALDVAKGIGLLAGGADPAAGLPLVAVPTTAGTGAETNGFGVLADPTTHRKVYLGAESVRPRAVVLDPALTVGVPPIVTAATGMDALTHGVESLASRGSSPLSEAYAARAITMVGGFLERAVVDGADLEARGQLLLAAHLAGRALTLSGLGLVHGIAHTLTGLTGAAHGLALSAVLDTVMEASAPAAGEPYRDVARSLRVAESTGAAVDACRELAERVGARRTLSELGATEAMVPELAEGALADVVSRNAPWLPRPEELTDLLLARL